jgi:spore coat-associated protein N
VAANRASGVPGEPRADPPALPRACAPRAATAEGVQNILYELEALVAAADHTTRRRQHRRSNRARRRARAGRIGTALGLIGTTGVSAHVASATFTGSAAVSQSALTAGTMSITLDGHAHASQYFDLTVGDLQPGTANQRQRLIDVTIGGSVDFKTLNVVITATAGHSSALDTDTNNGIQLLVERCSVGWTASGSSPDATYSCSGTQTTVWDANSGFTSVVGTKDLTEHGNSVLTVGSTNHYRFKFGLPNGSSTSMQGLSSTLSFNFTGGQRDGTNK